MTMMAITLLRLTIFRLSFLVVVVVYQKRVFGILDRRGGGEAATGVGEWVKCESEGWQAIKAERVELVMEWRKGEIGVVVSV